MAQRGEAGKGNPRISSRVRPTLRHCSPHRAPSSGAAAPVGRGRGGIPRLAEPSDRILSTGKPALCVDILDTPRTGRWQTTTVLAEEARSSSLGRPWVLATPLKGPEERLSVSRCCGLSDHIPQIQNSFVAALTPRVMVSGGEALGRRSGSVKSRGGSPRMGFVASHGDRNTKAPSLSAVWEHREQAGSASQGQSSPEPHLTGTLTSDSESPGL